MKRFIEASGSTFGQFHGAGVAGGGRGRAEGSQRDRGQGEGRPKYLSAACLSNLTLSSSGSKLAVPYARGVRQQRARTWPQTYVGIEYANLEAFAKAATPKLQADEEWNKVMKELDASGLREVIGNSLLLEVTP